MRSAVVVSTWVGSSPRFLYSLCDSIAHHRAGVDCDLFLSVNGVNFIPPAELVPRFAKIFTRDNEGYNIGAWDHAWRLLPDYDYFLFLQDECLIKKDNWLRDFIRCFESIPRCGLVGEHLIKDWSKPWSYLTGEKRIHAAGDGHDEQIQRARFYRQTLARWGIPEGVTARHLTTVVQFTARSILKEVGGYNMAQSYLEAIAAEIGFSRKIEACGYVLAQVGSRRHSRIGHPQWNRPGLWTSLRHRLRRRRPK